MIAACLPDDGIIDEIAIERAALGDPVRLTLRERQAAVEWMTARGYSAAVIAERLGCTQRTVTRRRKQNGEITTAVDTNWPTRGTGSETQVEVVVAPADEAFVIPQWWFDLSEKVSASTTTEPSDDRMNRIQFRDELWLDGARH